MPSVIPNPPVLATTINDCTASQHTVILQVLHTPFLINDRTASEHTSILQVLPSRLSINDHTASEHASILPVLPSQLPLLAPILADGGLQCSFFPPPPLLCAVRQRAASAGPVVLEVLNLLARRQVQTATVTTGMLRVATRIYAFAHTFMDTHQLLFHPAITS